MTVTTRTDSSIVRGSQSYTLTRTYRHGGDIFQVVVLVDSYKAQSYSVAQVLNADRKWTTLATADGLDTDAPNVMSRFAKSYRDDNALWSSAAGDLVETLKERAIAILG